ncbi:MAG: ATP synthase F1 subunit epsilon [Clostridiaceae bacterium]|nr:ATP synthase F1 subunit epsilon [Clostridiaceae bacterium]
MAKTFKLKIVSLNKKVFEGDIEKFFTKTNDGCMEILCNHAAMIASTVPCISKIVDDAGNAIEMFTSKGVLNMLNNELVFCLDAAETADEIDLDRAKKAKERAEKRLSDPSKYDVERAKLALARAITRIDFKNKSL